MILANKIDVIYIQIRAWRRDKITAVPLITVKDIKYARGTIMRKDRNILLRIVYFITIANLFTKRFCQ